MVKEIDIRPHRIAVQWYSPSCAASVPMCHCAIPLGDTSGEYGKKLYFVRPTRVHNPNYKSIGLAVFAQLTTETPYTLQLVSLSPKMPLPTRDLGPSLIYDSTVPIRTQNLNGISIGSAVFAAAHLCDRQTDRQNTLLGL